MATDDPTGFELTATGYRPSALPTSGTVVGTVDPTALPAIDDSTHECETGRKTPAQSRAALVWIAGIDSGKALPVEKRADLGSEDCGLDPSIVATTVGSTVNVYNDDAALHRFVFKGKPVDSAVTMPFFNTGQVVASERSDEARGLRRRRLHAAYMVARHDRRLRSAVFRRDRRAGAILARFDTAGELHAHGLASRHGQADRAEDPGHRPTHDEPGHRPRRERERRRSDRGRGYPEHEAVDDHRREEQGEVEQRVLVEPPRRRAPFGRAHHAQHLDDELRAERRGRDRGRRRRARRTPPEAA